MLKSAMKQNCKHLSQSHPRLLNGPFWNVNTARARNR